MTFGSRRASGHRYTDTGSLGPFHYALIPVLIAASCMLLVPIQSRTLVWIDAITIVMGLAALSLLWAAGQRLAQTGPALRRLGGVR